MLGTLLRTPCVLLSLAALAGASQARITRIVIDETVVEPAPASGARAPIAYEQVAGRAFGELDPGLPGNAIIQDIELAKDADGKVRYVASFVVYKPVDASKASGLMWHDVPNRGRVFPFAPQERASGDIMLASAWQGDNAGATAWRGQPRPPACSSCSCRWPADPAAARSPARCSAASSTARARLTAAAGADQSGALQAGVAGHQRRHAGVARRRNPTRRGHRRGRDPARPTGRGRVATRTPRSPACPMRRRSA